MSKNLKPNSSVPGTNRSTVTKFNPTELVNTTDISHYFFPLFYAGERGALGMWSKQIGLGHIKRRVENESKKCHVLELVNPFSNYGTSITIPKTEWQALHVTLPHFVMVLMGFRRNFSFDILILDNKGHRRRFTFATWFNPGNLKKFPFLCQLPLKLEYGWQEIHVDLEDLVNSTYRSRYVETLRIQVNSNCRLRQAFFCDDKIMNNEMPIPSMKMFENVKLLTTEFGPLNHPDYFETGPDRKRDHVIPDPSMNQPASRIERDMSILQLERFKELTCCNTKPVQSHYKTYFRNLLEEQQKLKRLAKAESKNKIEDLQVRSPGGVDSSQNLEDEDEVSEDRQGVPIPLDMKRSVNLMDLINKGKQKTPTGSRTRMSTAVSVGGGSAGRRLGQYDAPKNTGRPRSEESERDREKYYFRPANPFPPPNSK